MISELRRVKEAHRINLNIEEDIQNLFFNERVIDENIEAKINELREKLITNEQTFGSMNLSRPFMSSANLEETLRFEAENIAHMSTIREQQDEIDRLRRLVDGLQT